MIKHGKVLIKSRNLPTNIEKQAVLSKAELRDKVMASLQGHRWSLAQRFDVVVKDGTVHLWGVVPSDRVHQSYCETARHVSQPRAVVSHMHVMRHGVRMVQLE